MVQRSDDKGDKRSSGKSSESEARDAESSAANALRERIRQAGAAATARASDHAPPNGLIVPSSSAPPSAEHSGVRTRPPEPRSVSITPPLFGPPRLTPGAMSVPWPAAPRRRELQQTRTGIGVPPPPAPPAQDESSQPVGERPTLEVPLGQLSKLAAHAPPAGLGWKGQPNADAERAKSSAPPTAPESGPAPRPGTPRGIAPPPMDHWSLSTARTQPMPRVRGENASPESHDAQPREDPESEERRRAEMATTRKTHGLLRAPEPSSSSAGRYSVRDVSAEYVDTGVPEVGPSSPTDARPALTDEPITEEVPALDASASDVNAQSSETEADASRPRRSTPKQRVGHRRSSRPEMGHARERGTKRTDPGIRARTLRGGSGSSLAAKTAPQMPAAKATPPPAANPTPALGTPQPSAAKAQPTGGAITHRTSPLPAAPVQSRPPPVPVNSGSIVVDPSLSQPNLPAPSHLPVRAASRQAQYIPLPRDREAYEAFLRSAAGEHGGPPRARPSWAQQETALIPRDALEPVYEAEIERSMSPAARTRAVVGLILIALSAGVGWWILEGQTAPPKVSTPLQVAPATPSATATKPMTLIATEPTGAELILNGAVIGNTPLEVERPAQGDALYTLRFHGFEPQMVRITSTTRDAIHITLVPAPEPAPTPAKK
jgi:PEGA domain